MTADASRDRQAAARLLHALAPGDELACDQARELLPGLVEAELAGEDVDSNAGFAAVLRHLDACDQCMPLYVALAEDLAALAGTGERLPADRPPAPAFFAAARQSDRVVLRVLGGLRRRFELALQLPQLAPAMPTLSGGEQVALFADALPELRGAPIVSIALSKPGAGGELLIAISEVAASSRWEVRVSAGPFSGAASTDEHGFARIAGLPAAEGQQITVQCAELLTGA